MERIVEVLDGQPYSTIQFLASKVCERWYDQWNKKVLVHPATSPGITEFRKEHSTVYKRAEVHQEKNPPDRTLCMNRRLASNAVISGPKKLGFIDSVPGNLEENELINAVAEKIKELFIALGKEIDRECLIGNRTRGLGDVTGLAQAMTDVAGNLSLIVTSEETLRDDLVYMPAISARYGLESPNRGWHCHYKFWDEVMAPTCLYNGDLARKIKKARAGESPIEFLDNKVFLSDSMPDGAYPGILGTFFGDLSQVMILDNFDSLAVSTYPKNNELVVEVTEDFRLSLYDCGTPTTFSPVSLLRFPPGYGYDLPYPKPTRLCAMGV